MRIFNFFPRLVPIPTLPQIILHGIFDFLLEGRNKKIDFFSCSAICEIRLPPFFEGRSEVGTYMRKNNANCLKIGALLIQTCS